MGTRRPAVLPVEALQATRYLESSAVIAALLEHDAEALASLRELGQRVTSIITFVEAHRAVVRARATGSLTEAEAWSASRALRTLEQRIEVLRITDRILDRVRRPFIVEPVRTLDGIHLATIDLISAGDDAVTVVTRDKRVRANAKAAGWAVE
jgi:hypothetical protein